MTMYSPFLNETVKKITAVTETDVRKPFHVTGLELMVLRSRQMITETVQYRYDLLMEGFCCGRTTADSSRSTDIIRSPRIVPGRWRCLWRAAVTLDRLQGRHRSFVSRRRVRRSAESVPITPDKS